jgi:Contractile injection system tube protein/LysM domain
VPSLSATGLAHAVLVLLEPPPSLTNEATTIRNRIPLQFNPERIVMSKSASWERSLASKATTTTMPEFRGAAPRVLTLDLFLDAALGFRNTVEDQVEALLGCCVPTYSSVRADRPSPPWVRLEWGLGRSMAFTACVMSVNATYTRFAADGSPTRATAAVKLEEIGGTVPNQNPTSGSPRSEVAHEVQAGDSLASLAFRQYGDASQWRVIADANGIVDPERLIPGTTLLFPPLLPERGAGTTSPARLWSTR